MSLITNKFLSSTRWSLSYITVIALTSCLLVVYSANKRINDFKDSHKKIAKTTTDIVAREISKRIKDQSRLLKIFAQTHSQLIYQVSKYPQDDQNKHLLNKKIEESFPNYFAVSIADKDGLPVLDDFDGNIGGLCLEDLKKHAEGIPQPIKVHPNDNTYHIDIIVPWSIKLNKKHEHNLLFVSFKPDFLYELLKISSPANHELMLVNNVRKNLIEITEKGTRDVLKRNDFHLNANEKQRQLYSAPVENTSWDLMDSSEKDFFKSYIQEIIIYSFIIIFLFVMSSVLMAFFLIRLEKERLRSEKIKEEMFSLFNHDLRAPLSSIHSFLDMMVNTTLISDKPDKCKRLSQLALNNSSVMQEIVDNILDVQKMDAGEMTYDFKEIEITKLVKDTVDMSKQSAIKNDVILEFTCLSDEIYSQVDALRIKQAITNLLSNAIKYSKPHETVQIIISKNNSNVDVEIKDQGPGIEKEFQSIMFNKFTQSKSKLTKNIAGTGLGLTIVKNIVDAHHGALTFISNAANGTAFKISLPLK